MKTTMQQMREWRGPAILSYGFRPFFLGAGLWAGGAMALWLLMLTGRIGLPTAFDPVSWHAHEFLYGYLSAVTAGFLLTSVPNWTGRLPIIGWPLGGLFLLWLAGRVTVFLSAGLGAWPVALVDLAMPVTLLAVLTREIVAGGNWRNLPVLGLLAVMILGNATFHWEAARGLYAAQGHGLRLGLAAAIMLIAVIGGRIVPSFTRNWLVKRGSTVLPVPPMQRFDKISLLVLFTALAAWVFWTGATFTAVMLVVAGILHVIRLARWAGHLTTAEPLLLVLHIGYGFLPLGALGLGVAIFADNPLASAPALHLWMAGTIGLMTLGVMTRATLGHTGQTLTASRGTTAVYALIIVAALSRAAAALWPDASNTLHMIAGGAWIAAYGGFAALFAPLLLRARPATTR